jgi:hypothetical protein
MAMTTMSPVDPHERRGFGLEGRPNYGTSPGLTHSDGRQRDRLQRLSPRNVHD